MSAPTNLKVTEAQRQLSRFLAQSRTRSHEGTRRPEADLGDASKQEHLEYFGSLGEIVLLEATERDCLLHGKPFPAKFKLWLEGSCPDPDIITPTMRLDIKTLPPGWNWLNINKAKNDGPDSPDYYLAVAFSDEKTAKLLHPISPATVRQWPQATMHSGLYGVDLRNVRLPYYEGDLWRLVNTPRIKKPLLVATPSAVLSQHSAAI